MSKSTTEDPDLISIHAPLTGSDIIWFKRFVASSIFQSTLLTGSDIRSSNLSMMILHFNPRSPHRERLLQFVARYNTYYFQSTLLTGSDASYSSADIEFSIFQSTLPHRERRKSHQKKSERRHFNPRSPHRERQMMPLTTRPDCLFQSTLPSQGATTVVAYNARAQTNFNPRSPHRERP